MRAYNCLSDGQTSAHDARQRCIQVQNISTHLINQVPKRETVSYTYICNTYNYYIKFNIKIF